MSELMNEGAKKTVILGATSNPSRYAFLAAKMLSDRNIPFVPVGISKGEVLGENIVNLREKPAIDDVHTITLYVGPQNQTEWYDYILSLKPSRIFFNPGTENQELIKLAKENDIDAIPACTLVMLSSGQY